MSTTFNPTKSDEKNTMQEDKASHNEIAPAPEMLEGNLTKDLVFGEISERGPNFRNLGWLGAAALMMKTQIGLGVLSLPLIFNLLGMVPGAICLCIVSVLNGWSNYMVGNFKLRHPEVYGIADVGGLLLGRAGREFFGVAFCLYETFAAGSGMLSISISFNALSDHGFCTAAFVAIAACLGFGLGSVRTLSKVTWLAWAGLACILTAIFTLAIALGVIGRPSTVQQNGPWTSDFQNVGQPSFTDTMTAISSLIFAYAGTPSFFPIVSEMRNPQHYTRALCVCQITVTVTYIIIGVVVYYFAGSYVSSPALGTAGPLMKKVCYGFALPGLIVTTFLLIHMTAKYVFVRVLRGSKHLSQSTPVHWMTWLACTAGSTVVAYIIASAVPKFSTLIALVGALLSTLMSYHPMAGMWLYDNWGRAKSDRTATWLLMVGFCGFMLTAGTFIMVGGVYSAVLDIIGAYKGVEATGAWSCADNSGG